MYPDASNFLAHRFLKHSPYSDFDGTPVLSNAFPWLFPGGIADYWESNRGEPTDPREYAAHLLRLFNGEHERDKFFSFFILNKIHKRENSSSGGFFLKSWLGRNPLTVEDLQDQLRQGNTSFISKLQYFSQKIRGSDSYWRLKKYELKSWIDHHIHRGHGAPSLFITLSCAENWWVDLRRLLSKRVQYYDTELSKKICDNDYASVCKAARDHPLLVQEFFQIRFDTWMNTVGKKVYKIKYWWGRYEFAPGRGQIHIHLLAIADNMTVLKHAYAQKSNVKKAAVIAKYAKEVFQMTAEHPGVTVENNGSLSFAKVSAPEGCASKSHYDKSLGKRFTECDDIKEDRINLCNAVCMHKCNSGCLKFYGRYVKINW